MKTFVSTCVLLLASGCLPGRDNTYDPANAPKVEARVADFTDASGTCPESFVQQATFSFVQSASRGRCLAIDARATTDAGGNLAGAGWTFRYIVMTSSGGGAVEVPADDPPTTATLDVGMRRSLPSNRALTIRLEVRDPHGNRGSAEIPFVLLNDRPIAHTDPFRVAEAGGPPWAAGSATTVMEFSGAASEDADGDPLSLCWTFPGMTENCGPMAAPPGEPALATTPVPVATPGRFLARLRAWDGSEYSEPVFAAVDVSRSSVWTSAIGQRADRFDGATHVGRLASTGIALDAVATGPVRAGLAYLSTSSQVHFTEGAIDSTLSAGIDLAPSSIDVDGNGLPDVVLAADTDTQTVFAIVSGDTLLAVDLASVPFSVTASPLAPLPLNRGYLMEADGLGGVLVADHAFGPTAGLGFLEHVDATGAVTRLVSNDRVDFTSLARKPGTHEIWISTVNNPGDSTTPIASGISRYDADQPGSGATLVAASDDGVSGIGWVDESRLWVALPGEGLRLVDADALEAGATIDLATRFDVFLDGATVDSLFVDLGTGDAIGAGLDPLSGARILFRVSAAGSISRTAVPPYGRVDMIAADGRLISETLGPLTRSFGLGLSPANAVHASFAGGFGYDAATGGLWALVSNPHGIARYAPDARLLDFSTTVLDQGASRPFPILKQLTLAPDSATAYGFHFSGPSDEPLVALDLRSDPPAIRTVDPDPQAADHYLRIRASAPLPASTPFLWVHEGPAIPGTSGGAISLLDPLSGPPAVPVFTPQPGEYVDGMEIAAASNDLCLSLSTELPGPGVTFRQMRISTDGTAAVLQSETRLDFALHDLGTFGGHSGSADACFFFENLTDDPGGHVRVLGWDAAGVLIADEDFIGAGRALDGVAVSANQLWLVMEETTPIQADRMLLVELGASPGSARGFPSSDTLQYSFGFRRLVRF